MTGGDGPFAYNFSKLIVRVVQKYQDIVQVMNAIMDDITKTGKNGLDAEWNIIQNGMQFQTGISKILKIQIAYRGAKNKIQVIIFRTDKLLELPLALKNLPCNNDIIIVGNKVSGDLKMIGEDFRIREMHAVEQKDRSNVCNHGLYARERDVV